ncbi:MAG: MvaI/BcnI restriction endonuclease family protein [Alphaproteobacteria bacterium]|nr:MvaI/BcnI restriction endonuclease family protein [Alphaproteobacteria bacterium]MCK5518399.1 MvaI/BcnI restriction endonuclease family protein [Alphaproteobacteria bacterium]MCK5555662.1 MvaI/BcnI restriction endonuclease family protein [Alphaproteobacteria bacterium]
MSDLVEIYTKDTLIEKLKEIREMGWIETARPGNVGGVGNTVEDLLGIKENNLPIPNAAEWELKCQRIKSSALITLFHMEPSPTALKFVPSTMLPKYGWAHKEAGNKYPKNEMSFRQTISTQGHSDRGFMVKIDRNEEKVLISFDSSIVANKHVDWLEGVYKKIGSLELNPQPYWGFDDLYHKAGTKLHNCFFLGALHKKINGIEHFQYSKIYMLKRFSKERFIQAIEHGDLLVDFDARTGHNHGTKFRFRNNRLPELYEDVTEL